MLPKAILIAAIAMAVFAQQGLDLQLQLGNTAVRAGRYDEALQAFQQALAAVDKDSKAAGDLYLRIGETYRRKGDFESAEANLRRAVGLLPDNGVALIGLADLLTLQRGGLDEALSLMLHAVQVAPENDAFADKLGWIYLMKNRSDDGIRVFSALAARSPASATYRFHLGMAHYQKGDQQTALKQLQEALASNPSAAERSKIQALLDTIKP